MNLDLLNTLDDADRIVATDLYPARCRTVISALAAALRSMSTDLAESRVYGLALVAELKARSGQEAEAEARVAGLVAALEACVASLERADTKEGVCCCGDSMDRHSAPMCCGHSPVDMGDYYAGKALKAARATLAKMRAHLEDKP